jgi:hypothetical protein
MDCAKNSRTTRKKKQLPSFQTKQGISLRCLGSECALGFFRQAQFPAPPAQNKTCRHPDFSASRFSWRASESPRYQFSSCSARNAHASLRNSLFFQNHRRARQIFRNDIYVSAVEQVAGGNAVRHAGERASPPRPDAANVTERIVQRAIAAP